MLIVLLFAGTALGADKPPQRGTRRAPAPPLSVAPISVPDQASQHPFATTATLETLAPADEASHALEPAPFVVGTENRVQLRVTHAFSRDMARERITQLLSYWAQRFGVKSEWHGFRVFLSGRVLGVDIRALFDVHEHEVLAMASDPGTVLRSTAESYVDKKLRKYLSPGYDEP